MTEREFQTIIDKLDILERNDQLLTEKLELYAEKLDLYKQVSDEKIAQIQQSLEQSQKTSDAQINAIRFKINK